MKYAIGDKVVIRSDSEFLSKGIEWRKKASGAVVKIIKNKSPYYLVGGKMNLLLSEEEIDQEATEKMNAKQKSFETMEQRGNLIKSILTVLCMFLGIFLMIVGGITHRGDMIFWGFFFEFCITIGVVTEWYNK